MEKKKIYMVFVGQSGKGKSSLIGLIGHYLSGITKDQLFKEDKDKIVQKPSIIRTENERDASRSNSSCTIRPVSYSFHWVGTPYEIVMVDTAGLFDTAGPQADDTNVSDIIDALSRLPYLDALVWVNSSTAKDDYVRQLVFRRLHNLFPVAEFRKIIYPVFTGSRAKKDCDWQTAKEILLDETIQKEDFIALNNDLFDNPGDIDTDQKEEIENHYQSNIDKVVIPFLKRVVSNQARPDLSYLKDMIRIRCQIKLKIISLIKQLGSINAHEKSLLSGSTYTVFSTVQTDYHNTTCVVCATLCHEHCALSESVVVGDNIFKHCSCMGTAAKTEDITCVRRTCEHSYKFHVHVRYKVVEQVATNLG
eukprot:TRINITY_DN3123_c0_g1_i2.p1 TRINITY_DN3123_c0_g1~~TRINITY_DN3123_c0_g1_i2.p1  ORF type:complete len:363 (-),score=40.77 TRINITY_DN3123_c0_g1_i2:81-1169(-)